MSQHKSPDLTQTSRSLLRRLQSDDAAAWDRLVSLYAPLVWFWCRRSDLDDHEGADVFQEVFQAAAANIQRFRKDRPGDSFRGWLRTITRNKVIDHFRRQQKEPRGIGGTEVQRRVAQAEAEPDMLDDEQPGGEDSGDSAAPVADEHMAIGGVLRSGLEHVQVQFEDRTWKAFWCTAIDGRPTSDVADDLGMSPGAVRVAKSRVLQRLREELGELQ